MNDQDRQAEDRGVPLQYVVTDTSDRRLALLWLGAFVVAVAALTVVVVAIDDPPVALVVVLGVVAAAALIGAWMKVRVWVGWSNPELLLPSSEPLHLGDHVHGRFRRATRRTSASDGIEVRAVLQVEERIKASGDRQHAVETEIVYSSSVEVEMGEPGSPAGEVDLVLDIPLHEAPPTMDLGNNEVRWSLVIDTSAPGVPDDRSTFALEVSPVVAQRLQSGGSGR